MGFTMPKTSNADKVIRAMCLADADKQTRTSMSARSWVRAAIHYSPVRVKTAEGVIIG